MYDNAYMNSTETKAKAVREMFSSIARRYDFLNHFLSLGIDIRWRKEAVALFGSLAGKNVLDVACGTGDLAIAIVKAGDDTTTVTGADFSKEMLKIGIEKIKKNNLARRVTLEEGDALNLKYDDSSFDCVSCAFGVRNFADLDIGLKEMSRVLKKGGTMVVLEFTAPKNRLVGLLYRFYFTRLLPVIGGVVSGKKSAYTYLPDSVYKFPSPPEFKKRMESVGLSDVSFIPLTLGICGIHTGVKT